MSYLYLVRHAQAAMPDGEACCIGGRTDVPLSAEGRRQAAGLYRCFRGMERAPVYASPLRRSVQTARLLAGQDGLLEVKDGLRELDMGEWDGKPFSLLRREYPELYRRRGTDHSLQPPGAESYQAAAERMDQALRKVTDGLAPWEERVAVSHCGAIRAFLCSVTGLPFGSSRLLAQPYGCVNVLERTREGWRLLLAGFPGDRIPDDRQIRRLWDRYGAGEEARCHSEAVARKAVALCRQPARCGLVLDEALIRSGALLHDLCRQERHHPQAAARLLRQTGYFRVAAVVAAHEGPDEQAALNEEGIVFLADKLVMGEREVTIRERFANSREKCGTEQALANHRRRLRQALQLRAMYLSRTGGGVEQEKELTLCRDG